MANSTVTGKLHLHKRVTNLPKSMAKTTKRALLVGLGAFFLAILVGYGSQGLLENIPSIEVAFALLLLIILVGIVFDVVGVAATVAIESPFHAKAAKKIPGAPQAIQLIRNADRVASFCNDVVGDISGTLSGATGVAIIFRLLTEQADGNKAIAGTLMTALVAALTIGGKAYGKSYAIGQANEIIYRVAKILAWAEVKFGLQLFKGRRKKVSKKVSKKVKRK
ncbi:MAG: hypothetical protein ACYC2T_00075 [Bacillota bacterium]